MNRHSLLFVTVVVLGLTGMLLLNVEGSPVARRPTVSRLSAAAKPINPCTDPAARQWLHVQPHHWRDCILQH
jgi:hypothetical protein